MDWPMILLGIIIGLIIIASIGPRHEQQLATSAMVADEGIGVPGRSYPDPVLSFERIPPERLSPESYPQRSTPQEPSPSPNIANERVSPKELLETWRKSIVGLVRLAQGNLALARQRLEAGDYEAAVEGAVTSVENISRALMHCYGEKPELNLGQEEALRLLCRRFIGNEKIEFEKAIVDVVQLYHNKIVQRYRSKHNIGFCFLHTETRTRLILGSASKIVALFAQIIDEHFATEIPELGEACPKCHALDVSVWSFNGGTANYTCNLCRHKWIQPRTF